MGLFANNKRIMVVSVDGILQSKGVRGRAAPRQQLQVLRALSRMVQREKLRVTAVIVGKPLNKAPNNKEFEGVRVRYVMDEKEIGKALVQSLKQAGSAGVLVTEDVALENKVLHGGRDTLRTSTFRKLLDDGGGDDGGRQENGKSRDRGNSDRKNRRNRSDRRKQSSKPQKKKENKPKQGNKPKREQDEISQMIDLVD